MKIVVENKIKNSALTWSQIIKNPGVYHSDAQDVLVVLEDETVLLCNGSIETALPNCWKSSTFIKTNASSVKLTIE